jgi:60 kDa SS-A/Ro ribonucleoprotein
VDGQKQLDEVNKLVQQVRPEFLARLAVYSRESAYMKDMSAYLLACLLKVDLNLFKTVFSRVVDNGKMLRNFVQIIRSGQVGRKSFGSAPKRMIREWLEARPDGKLFNDSVGNDPSLKDVIKMVHPKPTNKTREALYAYLIDKEVKNPEALPKVVRDFETFKKSPKGDRVVPQYVDFQMLTALDLSDTEWKKLSEGMAWHALRMNLNTLERHGVLKDEKYVDAIAAKLTDEKAIKSAKVFPYQLFTAYLNIDSNVPTKLGMALQKAMEVATTNIPKLNCKTIVAVDCSGSMDCAVTGNRGSATSKTTCKQVAALIAACILRGSDSVEVMRFTTSAERVKLNPMDSVITNAKTIGTICGGTTISSPVALANSEKLKADLFVIVSDNESWADTKTNGCGTELMKQWSHFKSRNPKARLVCIDLAANAHTQAPNAPDRLNIGGFSDACFSTIAAFLESNDPDFWVKKINQIDLTPTSNAKVIL